MLVGHVEGLPEVGAQDGDGQRAQVGRRVGVGHRLAQHLLHRAIGREVLDDVLAGQELVDPPRAALSRPGALAVAAGLGVCPGDGLADGPRPCSCA
ncbi:hypothetical protein GCM10025734_46250 [Kitasatospora paranensis]